MFFVPDHGYYLVESVGIAANINEFLLQSVADTIRVFPCWPMDKTPASLSLRTQGGFLVSVELKGGKIVKVDITSTVGGKLRVVDPWTGKIAGRETKFGECQSGYP